MHKMWGIMRCWSIGNVIDKRFKEIDEEGIPGRR